MKFSKKSKFLFVSSNISLVTISVVIVIYSISNLILAQCEAKTFFNVVNKDYEACFGKKYVHENSYFEDITCMKMEIATDIITKSNNLKTQYSDNLKNETNQSNNSSGSNGSETLSSLKKSISDIQEYNNAIEYKKSSLALLNYCNSLYSSLNYMTYGSDALLIDIINFLSDKEALTLAADKDTQQIHVMANMSTNIVLNLKNQIYIYQYSILVSLFILLGTILNIYGLRARKNKYRRKKRNNQNK